MNNVSIPALTPHKYPWWIVSSFLFAFVPLTYFALELPDYFNMSTVLKNAEKAFIHKDYYQAIEYYQTVLQKAPDCRKAKIRLAECYFSFNIFELDVKALKYLARVELKKEEWRELTAYMPEKYWSLFNSKGRYV